MTTALQIRLHTKKIVHIRNYSSETKLRSLVAIALWFGHFQPSPINMTSVSLESLSMYCKWRVNLVLNSCEQNANKSMGCKSSGFLFYMVYGFDVLGCHKAWVGRCGPTFRNSLSVPSSRVKMSFCTAWSLTMAPIYCPETSVNDYEPTLLNTTEERRPKPMGC